MNNIINSGFKLGILGGGQLGKMLALAAQNWELETWILDASEDFPAASVCSKFVKGDFKNYDDVYNFGKQVDVLTIEIEHVNTEALAQLEKEGVTVHPSSKTLNIIKDKGLQKQFYKDNNIPTSPFELYESKDAILKAIDEGHLNFPFVQKSRTAGYDGRGVAVIKDNNGLLKLMDTPSLIEPLVNIHKEIAVIVAKNEKGQTKVFPPVEMEFNPLANLVEFLICPANISPEINQKAVQLAEKVIKDFDLSGLLAVELFLDQNNDLLVNEVAPRTHNSGHHTIDSCVTSQFQQQLRAVINLPLGSTEDLSPSIMLNLLGADGYSGNAKYEGIEECMAVEGAKFHLYGKTTTKPFRKMGHVTVIDSDLEKAKEKANFIKNTLRIIA
jgi:5-(carboxyamino)imidazole ribonucleotide synthase